MLNVVLISTVLGLLAVFGAGVFPFTLSFLSLGLCLACVLAYRREAARPLDRLHLLLSLLIFIMVLSLLPLPDWIFSFTGSIRAEQNRLAGEALDRAAQLGLIPDAGHWFSFSRNRGGTARLFLLLVSGIAIACLASRLSAPWKGRMLRVLVLLGTALAVAGYVTQWLAPQGKTIWGLFPVEHGRPVACFINRSHFGGYLALLCPAALALAAETLDRRRCLAVAAWSACFIAMSFAVFLSLSKGAWLAWMGAMACVGVILLVQKRYLPLGVMLLSVLVAFGSVWAGRNEHLVTRMTQALSPSTNDSLQMRLATWKDGIRILKVYPFMGAGGNAFRAVFPQFRQATTRKPFVHAENEYIQIPVEMGIPATAAILGILLAAAVRWRSAAATGRLPSTVSLASAGAMAALFTHATVDFPLRVPLYFLTALTLMGFVMSSDPSPDSPPPPQVPRSVPFIPLSAFLLCLVVSLPGRKLYEYDLSDSIQTAPAAELAHRLAWSPTAWDAWYYLGRAAVQRGTDRSIAFGEQCITRAAEYDRNNYLLWKELCLLRLSLKDMDGAQDAYRQLKTLRSWMHIRELEKP